MHVMHAGGFPPRSLSAVAELRRQVRLFLRRQLDACLEADPAHPDVPFMVLTACNTHLI